MFQRPAAGNGEERNLIERNHENPMRIKNAGKGKAFDATPDSEMEEWERFRHGNKCDDHALSAIWTLRFALGLAPAGLKIGGRIGAMGTARFSRTARRQELKIRN